MRDTWTTVCYVCELIRWPKAPSSKMKLIGIAGLRTGGPKSVYIRRQLVHRRSAPLSTHSIPESVLLSPRTPKPFLSPIVLGYYYSKGRVACLNNSKFRSTFSPARPLYHTTNTKSTKSPWLACTPPLLLCDHL